MTTNEPEVQRCTDMGSETICPINNMRKSDYGEYVLYEDYDALQAKCDALVEALELALEYWRHRQQRYKNRRPVWVKAAEKSLYAHRKGGAQP